MKPNLKNLSELLDGQNYLDSRRHPDCRHPDYLHLKDLVLALTAHGTDEVCKVMDYGCGGSPYRYLFPNAEYTRSDIEGSDFLDYVIGPNSRCTAPNDHYDVVLSTQVLEHCPKPEEYLEECYRLLQPGGKLVLSTHGLYGEHGCPYDFTRWTEDGLRALIVRAGFEVVSAKRLTVGPRAGFLLLTSSIGAVHHEHHNPGWKRVLWRAMKWGLFKFRPWLHAWLDAGFPQYAVCEGRALPGADFYVALLFHAKK